MKKFYQSKVLWFNLLALVVGVVGQYGFADFVPSPDLPAWIVVVTAVLNMVLRAVTNKGLEM